MKQRREISDEIWGVVFVNSVHELFTLAQQLFQKS